jgi:hypothetical protein
MFPTIHIIDVIHQSRQFQQQSLHHYLSMKCIRDSHIYLANLSSVATEQSENIPPQATTLGHPRAASSVLHLI